ncbi:MAG: CDP-alcohol phosphatidyltransferase family protein [Patescibacteria group bacterium]
MALPFWIRRPLLWCRLAFEGLTRWKERMLYAFFKLPLVAPLFRYITPNDLCYLRMFAGVIIIFLYLRGFYSALLPVFAVAVTLDFIDGPLARYSNLVSEEGKVLDANADKVLVLIPLLLIGFDRLNGQLVTWLMVVEFFLFLVANYLKPILRGRYGIPLVSGSNSFGQIKMAIESVAIGIVLYDPTSTTVIVWGQWLIFFGICFGILSLLRHLGRVERGAHLDPHKRLITVPNLITLGSLFLFIPAGFAIAHGQWVIAAVYIGLVFISDWLDGFIARKFHQETYFGAALDPFRDFLARGFLTGWMIALLPPAAKAFLAAIVITEIFTAVMNIRTSIQIRQLFGVTFAGKVRGFVHYLAIGALFLYLADAYQLPLMGIMAILSVMLLASLAGLISYVNNRSRLLEEKR